MLIDRYRNGIIGEILGKIEFVVPDTIYMGISTTPVNNDGSGITEPSAASGYARVQLPNNSNTWNTPVSGTVTNKIIIQFPELQTDSGTAVAYFLAEGSTGSAFWADSLSAPRVLSQFTTLYINPSEAQFMVSNTST